MFDSKPSASGFLAIAWDNYIDLLTLVMTLQDFIKGSYFSGGGCFSLLVPRTSVSISERSIFFSLMAFYKKRYKHLRTTEIYHTSIKSLEE